MPQPAPHTAAGDIGWIERVKLADETGVVAELLRDIALTGPQREAIVADAAALVQAFRDRPKLKTLLDAFLQEYGLETEEGVALMCLAESLLRVPDGGTRDDLIADKLSVGDWKSHLGESDTLLVNASSLGLLLTGRVVRMGPEWGGRPDSVIGKLTNRLGEPVIRAATARAMKILGGEFVLGETLPAAIRRGRREFGAAQLYSFDMLGEGARSWADAQRYLAAYHDAIRRVGAMKETGEVTRRSGVSVKLSALHPRYSWAHRESVMERLTADLLGLAQAAREAGIKLTVDAEEADRLGLSLHVFEAVARQLAPTDWPGFGLAVQAYGKRARRIIDWVARLGRELGTRFMVRLVKGAYWDAEVKHAQEQGWESFPVFTRKSTTDLSYLACAQDMLARTDVLFCQFATHNAHTIAAVMSLGEGQGEHFEFQRLHGMGEGLYRVAAERYPDMPPVRIYAPVGGHRDLLAYLVRRLLENGANSSFVNRFMDADVPAREVVEDPVALTRGLDAIPHPSITPPPDLFQPARDNADGFDLSDPHVTSAYEAVQGGVYAESFAVASLTPIDIDIDSTVRERIANPSEPSDLLGHATPADPRRIGPLFDAAARAQPDWNARGGAERARLLRRAADALEADALRLMAVLVREAGKTRDDALAELREAVDFLRYYAAQAEREFDTPTVLPGPTGERNTLRLSGRGTFVCIAPWNFPLAIFVGQVAAALAAGNAAIAKPAEQTPIIGTLALGYLHAAGVPAEVLQSALGGADVGAALVEHAGADGVAFTGSTRTALTINRALAAKDGPIVPLIAETGGQNVMFVDSTALLEQVTDDVIASAFLSAGQRCSALRVLYLQDDIADAALRLIRGAMDTLTIGDPRHYSSDVGPVIDARAKAALEDHIADMKRRGFAHHSVGDPDGLSGTFVAPHLFEIDSMADLGGERFGPVLHVVRWKAGALDAALADAFSSGFGLTLGVHTRMDSRWKGIFARAPVGNTYVNRNMVGAVVGSQPFGGQGLSGTGFKAGGPRYLYRFAHEKTLSVNTMASGGNTELLRL